MRVTSTKRKALKLYGNRRSRRYEPQFHCGASHRTVLAYYCHAIAVCRNCLVPSLGYSSFKSSQVTPAGSRQAPQQATELRLYIRAHTRKFNRAISAPSPNQLVRPANGYSLLGSPTRGLATSALACTSGWQPSWCGGACVAAVDVRRSGEQGH